MSERSTRWVRRAMPAALSLLTSEGLEGFVRVASGATRRLSGARPRLRVFIRIDDPHSHLLLQALERLRPAYDVELELRVAGQSDPADLGDAALHAAWSLRDAAMIAPHAGLSFEGASRAKPARAALADRVLTRHRSDPDALGVFLAVSDAFWSTDEDALAAWPAASEGEAERERQTASAERSRLGHYLGATTYYEGEWYWGVDRLALLERRLHGEGHRLLAGDEPLVSLPIRAQDTTHPGPGAAAEVEVFYSFRSPYAYLGLERAHDLFAGRGVRLIPRPVAPMVRRGATVSRAKRIYIVRDVARLAREAGVPFGRMCDPLPGFERAAALYELAIRHGLEVAFLRSYGRGVWAEGRDVMRDADLLSLAERAGLPAAEAEAALRRGAQSSFLDDNAETLRGHGLWGVPSFVYRELAVWGQDRLWLIDHALRG